jgi:hypothetical protein
MKTIQARLIAPPAELDALLKHLEQSGIIVHTVSRRKDKKIAGSFRQYALLELEPDAGFEL